MGRSGVDLPVRGPSGGGLGRDESWACGAVSGIASSRRKGAVVEAFGLKGAPELNGRRGQLQAFDPATGRWQAALRPRPCARGAGFVERLRTPELVLQRRFWHTKRNKAFAVVVERGFKP